ncbi:MAG: hypothetical protein IT291_09635 [Deltaproteobacteria bacterium]|nr:hypothetical protein [Deltaproteobacteria bacterium]
MIRLIFFLLLLFFSACHRLTPRPFDSTAYRSASPEVLHEVSGLLREDVASIKALKALARVRISRGVKSENFRQVIVFRRPDKLRIDFLERSSNALLSLLSVHDGVMKVVDLSNKVAYIGDPSLENIRELMLLPLSLDEVMLLFCGRFDAELHGELVEARLLETQANDGVMLMQYVYASNVQVDVRFSLLEAGDGKKIPRIFGLDVRDNAINASIMSAEFIGERGVSDRLALPKKLQLSMPAEEIVIAVEYEDLVVNPDIAQSDADLFDVTIPPGMKVSYL